MGRARRSGPWMTPSLTPPNPNETVVSVVQSDVAEASLLTQAQVRDLVRQAVELAGGLDDVIEPGDVVVIKPNLVGDADFTGPRWTGSPLAPEVNGVTTDWRVAAAVVELAREQSPGAIYVMEGSAAPSTATVRERLNYTSSYFTAASAVDGFVDLEASSGDWLDTSSSQLVSVPLVNGLLRASYYYNRQYYQADVIISVPTLKTHWHAAVTGAVKNLGIGAAPANIYGSSASSSNRLLSTGPGTNPDAVDHAYVHLHYFIHDYYLGRPADFVVMDGLQGIQNGPTPCYEYTGKTSLAEDQMNMRLVLAGRDGVAVDTIESLVMQWDPTSVQHLARLSQSGVGTTDTANIRVVGRRVDQVRTPFECVRTELAAGGSPVSDLIPPTMSLQSWSAMAGYLFLSVNGDTDLRKVEIYLGSVLVEPPVTTSFDTITLDVSGFGPGTYDLTALGYDYYLNVTEQTLPGAVVVQ